MIVKLKREVEKHKGELVLDMFNVVMLVGFSEDSEDYYYEYLQSNGETIKSSCVGDFIPLKDSLPKKQYAYLCDIFYINAIEAHLKFYEEMKNLIKNKIGRDPKAPSWG